MSSMTQSLYNLRLLDQLADKKTFVHRIHPLAKLITTLVYLVVVVSFGKYEISGLLPLIFYPVVIMALAEIPATPLLKRMLLAAPFVIGIGIFNPLYDHRIAFTLGSISVSAGWLSFFSILLKCALTVLAALLLIATTGMNRLAFALSAIKVPRILITELLLIYRYISLLLEEAARLLQAYSLRSPSKKGVHYKAWGSLAGQLLIRTFSRAERVHQAMGCRGFQGDFHMGTTARLHIRDILYCIVCIAFFITVRYVNITSWLGFMTGGLTIR